MKTLLRPFVTLFCLSLLVVSPLCAGDNSGGISVIGTATIKAKPTIAEMTASINGDGELAGDAVTKFNSNKRRAEKMIKNLNIKGLTVVNGGLDMKNALGAESLQAMMMRGGAPAKTSKFKLAIQEKITLRITGIDKLTDQELLDSLVKIIEAGLDSGLSIGAAPTMAQGTGGSGLATFKITDIDKLKEQAFEKAMKNAREQAERLAKLGGVKLGKVTSISQTPVIGNSKDSSSQSSYMSMVMMMYGMGGGSAEKSEFSSAVLRDIPVSVTLNVTFAIE